MPDFDDDFENINNNPAPIEEPAIDEIPEIDEAFLSDLENEIARREADIIERTRDNSEPLPEHLLYLWMLYADFEVMIVKPFIRETKPPKIIRPVYNSGKKEQENVYVILDHGYYFTTSRGKESIEGVTAMGKLYRTIQKMIDLMMKRIEELQASGEGDTNFDMNEDIKVALFGYELCCRKAFALIMNFEINVEVVNFDPRAWGERFITNMKYMMSTGHGYPMDLKNVAERVAPGS